MVRINAMAEYDGPFIGRPRTSVMNMNTHTIPNVMVPHTTPPAASWTKKKLRSGSSNLARQSAIIAGNRQLYNAAPFE